MAFSCFNEAKQQLCVDAYYKPTKHDMHNDDDICTEPIASVAVSLCEHSVRDCSLLPPVWLFLYVSTQCVTVACCLQCGCFSM
ncbi:hypothetical protein RRG08_031392 [Elysia crispata]|uniref:Uncharacterized protein n=1 Tax=Elysia crispata TaxID=231223 RepID=A0AAE0ZND9_9GAST|nr:hypothetical protein RRG08_031392 [Elysia crispata]